jgi:lysophospholipase L1-like esterase
MRLQLAAAGALPLPLLLAQTLHLSAVAATTIPAFSPGLTDYQGRVAVGKPGLPADSVSWDWLGSQVSVSLDGSSHLTATFAPVTKMVRLRCFVSFGKPTWPNGTDAASCHDWSYVMAHPHSCGTMGTPMLYPLSEIVLLPSIATYAIGVWPRQAVTVTIMNDQEWATGGVVTLLSLVSDGAFVKPVLPPTMATRRMVFVGDSITAGTNLRRPVGDAAFGIPMAPATPISGIMDDYPLTYQAQLCQAFGANCSTIAYGGKGMYRNCCDKGTTMPEYFQQRLTAEPARDYSFGADGFVPDVVVIALGTNDFSHCRSAPCTAEFLAGYTKTYTDFMVNVTRWYGKKDIEFFCGVGPITINYLDATRAAVANAVKLGIRATYVDMQACARPYPGGETKDGYCNGTATHPGSVGHRRMYEMTYNVIGEKLGWLPVKHDDDGSGGALADGPRVAHHRASSPHSELAVMGRTGYVYRPAASSAVSGAVLVLHGSGGVASDMSGLGFEALADAGSFLTVYPEMLTPRADEWGYLDDIPYFAALARRLQEPDFGVPADKIFICGHSAGGSMVTLLQNEMDEFAAAGVVEAAVGHRPGLPGAFKRP